MASETTAAATGQPGLSGPGSSRSIRVLVVLAVVGSLYLASDLLVPIAFAAFLYFLLSPLVASLARRGIPAAASAAVVVASLVATLVFAVSTLAGPAEKWLRDAPTSVRELQNQVFPAKQQLEGIQELAEEVDELAAVESKSKAQTVVVKGPGVIENVVGGLPAIAAFVGICVFLTYFLLASGDTLLRSATRCGRSWAERRRIVTIARQIQSELSTYLVTATAINVALGLAVAATMYALDVPNPLLWGAMATLFNFAPYVGALCSAAVLALVGLTTFESLTDALLVPAAFLMLTIIEGQLVTPTVLGRSMALNPIFVFLAVIVWGWLWGIAGALMAVPIMTGFKVICDHVPGFEYIGGFLRRQQRHSPDDRQNSGVQTTLRLS